MTCDICKGRGWVPGKRDWPDPCPFCGGRGDVSWGFVTRALGECSSTIMRIRTGRSRPATCERVFLKVMEVLR